jgi:ubiquitin carboxyl-terminal hydrolase L5
MSEWCTIESDPGVFTELIREIGVMNISVEEVYSLDDEILLESIKPIYGLIFLFKWTKKVEERECLKMYDADLFFARQVITNACATQAILSVLMNNSNLEIGDELSKLKEVSMDWDPQMKGLALSNSDLIRKVHNSFAKPEPFIYTKEKREASDKDDVYHFISYIPFKNKVYELDGLQPGPILLGSFEKEDQWIDIATEEINKRILK